MAGEMKPRWHRFRLWAPVVPAGGKISLEWSGGGVNLTPAEAKSLGTRLIAVAGVVEERRRRERCDREAEQVRGRK